MTTQNELGAKLKILGIRLTPQRLAIAEVVVNSGDHPSVKEIFGRVKEFFPYVILATVYSTLTVLQQAGIVRELPFQKHSRYDANLSPHVNLACVGCGSVHDADVGQYMVAELRNQLESSSDFHFTARKEWTSTVGAQTARTGETATKTSRSTKTTPE